MVVAGEPLLLESVQLFRARRNGFDDGFDVLENCAEVQILRVPFWNQDGGAEIAVRKEPVGDDPTAVSNGIGFGQEKISKFTISVFRSSIGPPSSQKNAWEAVVFSPSKNQPCPTT